MLLNTNSIICYCLIFLPMVLGAVVELEKDQETKVKRGSNLFGYVGSGLAVYSSYLIGKKFFEKKESSPGIVSKVETVTVPPTNRTETVTSTIIQRLTTVVVPTDACYAGPVSATKKNHPVIVGIPKNAIKNNQTLDVAVADPVRFNPQYPLSVVVINNTPLTYAANRNCVEFTASDHALNVHASARLLPSATSSLALATGLKLEFTVSRVSTDPYAAKTGLSAASITSVPSVTARPIQLSFIITSKSIFSSEQL